MSSQDRIPHSMYGQFENFINQKSAPSDDDPLIKRIMTAVTVVAQDATFAGNNAEYAGSRRKHTGVCGYSDVDIFVRCNEEVSSEEREAFSMKVQELLQYDNLMTSHLNRPVATAFECETMSEPTMRVSFDLVFEKASWVKIEPTPPSHTTDAFKDHPARQRAIRALKLLSKLNPTRFPHCSGFTLETFVVQEDEENNFSCAEDTSGLDLFLLCIRSIARGSSVEKLQKWKAGASELAKAFDTQPANHWDSIDKFEDLFENV